MDPSVIITTARSFLGVRWKHQGRSIDGLDCVGLIVIVAHQLKLTDYDTQAYSRRPKNTSFLDHFDKAGAIRIPIQQIDLGDIAIFEQAGYPCHTGLITNNGVIHSSMPRRKVVEEPIPSDIIAAYRFPQIT